MPELTPRVVFDCNLFVQGIANRNSPARKALKVAGQFRQPAPRNLISYNNFGVTIDCEVLDCRSRLV
jgi:hypothetical protein